MVLAASPSASLSLMAPSLDSTDGFGILRVSLVSLAILTPTLKRPSRMSTSRSSARLVSAARCCSNSATRFMSRRRCCRSDRVEALDISFFPWKQRYLLIINEWPANNVAGNASQDHNPKFLGEVVAVVAEREAVSAPEHREDALLRDLRLLLEVFRGPRGVLKLLGDPHGERREFDGWVDGVPHDVLVGHVAVREVAAAS